MKIKNALYEEREISLNEYREEMKGYLHCPCCGVSIIYVARYIRQSRDREIEVSPFFRVSKNPHLDSCKYLMKNRIVDIYRSIKEQNDEYDFIEKQGVNRFCFQLRIITDVNFSTKKNSSIVYGNNKTIDESHKTQQKVFLKTVKDIISLRDSIEADEENDLIDTLRTNIASIKERQGTVAVEFAKVSDISVDKVLRLISEAAGAVRLDPSKPNMIFQNTGKIGLKEKSEFIREKLERIA